MESPPQSLHDTIKVKQKNTCGIKETNKGWRSKLQGCACVRWMEQGMGPWSSSDIYLFYYFYCLISSTPRYHWSVWVILTIYLWISKHLRGLTSSHVYINVNMHIIVDCFKFLNRFFRSSKSLTLLRIRQLQISATWRHNESRTSWEESDNRVTTTAKLSLFWAISEDL